MKTKIIADACGNHLGNRDMIKQMIFKAGEMKVDYIKFQLFSANELNTNWDDYEKAYDNYLHLELSNYDIEIIIDKCRECNVKPLFTVFSMSRAIMLSKYTLDIVKIASPDADNKELVDFCTKTFHTVIISTGMTTSDRINKLRRGTAKLLYCISKYPTNPSEIDYNMIEILDGFSDHTLSIESAKKAIDLGTEYVERHFTLGKHLPGGDHFFSSEVGEFKELVAHRDYVYKTLQYKTRWTKLNDVSISINNCVYVLNNDIASCPSNGDCKNCWRNDV